MCFVRLPWEILVHYKDMLVYDQSFDLICVLPEHVFISRSNVTFSIYSKPNFCDMGSFQADFLSSWIEIILYFILVNLNLDHWKGLFAVVMFWRVPFYILVLLLLFNWISTLTWIKEYEPYSLIYEPRTYVYNFKGW